MSLFIPYATVKDFQPIASFVIWDPVTRAPTQRKYDPAHDFRAGAEDGAADNFMERRLEARSAHEQRTISNQYESMAAEQLNSIEENTSLIMSHIEQVGQEKVNISDEGNADHTVPEIE